MTTIREVARHAGVSPITVSRVVNNTGYIRAETREKVLAAVELLGYVPNTLARSLRWKQTGLLALVLTDITNPFWTTVARGVEDAASDAGLSVILCNTDESSDEQERYLTVLLQKRVDGILLVPAASDPAPLEAIRRQKIPVVVLDRRVPGVEVDVVRCDSRGGAFQLVQHLTRLGHRRIALLAGPEGISTTEERILGYRQALQAAEIAEAFIYAGAFTLQSGYDMAQQALANPARPSALFAGNNFIAIGALRAVRDAGLRIPEDISLVGFDDLPPALVVDPFLTAAAQPAYEMGFEATRLLLQRMAGDGPTEMQETILPVQLLERSSTGVYRKVKL